MIIAFDNQVSLGQSLSSRGVAYISGTSRSTIAFKPTKINLTNLMVNLTVNGSAISVDRAYNGVLFALINPDRTSSLFECVTATTVQSLTSNGTDSGTPEIRRMVSLGYL